MHLKINLKVLVVSVLLLFSFSANSQDFVCKSANLLGPKLITDICWRCIFPMKLAGATMNPFNATKEDPGEISSGSSDGWANGENSNPEFADLFYAYGVLDSGRFIGESSHLVGLGSNQASFYLRA